MLVRACLVLLLCLSAQPAVAQVFVCPTAPPGGATCNHPSEFLSCGILVNGIPRHFCIHEPSEEPRLGVPAGYAPPVILAFHGASGNGDVMVRNWDSHTEQGMVLVAPTALTTGGTAAGGACPPSAKTRWRHIGMDSPTWADLANADPCGGTYRDDLDLVSALVAEIQQQLDPSGFYATGFSSGAGMVHQLLITQPHAGLFDGFAAVSNVMVQEKIDAQAAAAGIAGLTPNQSEKVPFLFMTGLLDKVNSPSENIIESVTRICTSALTPPPHCSAACAVGGVTPTALDVMRCWRNESTYPVPGKHLMLTPRYTTAQWLIGHNDSAPRGIQSLYPDLGHGGPPGAEVDRTVVVRQDYAKKRGAADSEPVAVVTVLDGMHVWPGQGGDYPPCTNCDVDATQVILQFWRAHAGFHSLWR